MIVKKLTELTDLEINYLCALALGKKIKDSRANWNNIQIIDGEIFVPLIDDYEEEYGHSKEVNFLNCYFDAFTLLQEFNVSIMFRYGRSGNNYYHTQVGPEEPENYTLQTNEDLARAICYSVLSSEYGIKEKVRNSELVKCIQFEEFMKEPNIHLLYFKQSGKYYCNGEFYYDENSYYNIKDHVIQLHKNGKLPGLNSGKWNNGPILIDGEKHPHGFPILILDIEEEIPEYKPI